MAWVPPRLRSIAGTTDLHVFTRQRLANFKGAEDVITFNRASPPTLGTIPRWLGRGRDLLRPTQSAHRSLTDADSPAPRIVAYEHNDASALEDAIKEHASRFRRALIVTDGVFSMDGDIAPLPHCTRSRRNTIFCSWWTMRTAKGGSAKGRTRHRGSLQPAWKN